MTAPATWKPAADCKRSAGRALRQALAKVDVSAFVEGRWTGTGHLKLRRPCGCCVVASNSPSDNRATKNLASDVRRSNAAHSSGMAVCQK